MDNYMWNLEDCNLAVKSSFNSKIDDNFPPLSLYKPISNTKYSNKKKAMKWKKRQVDKYVPSSTVSEFYANKKRKKISNCNIIIVKRDDMFVLTLEYD